MFNQLEQLQSRLAMIKSLLPLELQNSSVLSLIQLALAEDLAADGVLPNQPVDGDISGTATIQADELMNGYIRVKSSGVIAGLPIAKAVYELVDPTMTVRTSVKDGSLVDKGHIIAVVQGVGRSLLASERTALNFLGRMSGIATLTRRFVDSVKGTKAIILDTRKTAPGSRLLDKYAVRMGGGQNHRTGMKNNTPLRWR
jgi:nicotinate-nucleotide pyrophosphorylase (carboxylating)